jgi:hypothetical protein
MALISKIVCFLIIFIFHLSLLSQEGSKLIFKNPHKKYIRIPFKMVNNLIIIPVKINNTTLKFILDTGVKNTLVTELFIDDSLQINPTNKIKIVGFGEGKPLDAYKSESNDFQIGSLYGKNLSIMIMAENVFQLTEKLGTKVNGLIGYDIFKDYRVEINTNSLLIKVFNPEYSKLKYLHSDTIPIKIVDGKPFINSEVTTTDGKKVSTNLIIDTGASDALWLFQNIDKGIVLPQKSFEMFLGMGINGDISGHKARINSIRLGKFLLNNPIVSFPDSQSVNPLITKDNRDGNIGMEVFRRFKVLFDYPNEIIVLQPNNNFDEKFTYNMSGIEISAPCLGLPIYVISAVYKNSPGFNAGLLIGDQLLELNNRNIKEYTLNNIYDIFMTNYNKNIQLKVMRNGVQYSFRFKLENRI